MRKIKSRLQNEFYIIKNRTTTSGRNLQAAICYPLLLMKDKAFFDKLTAEAFAPIPTRIDELIQAGKDGDIKQSLEIINLLEGIEDQTDGELYKKLIKSFSDFF